MRSNLQARQVDRGWRGCLLLMEMPRPLLEQPGLMIQRLSIPSISSWWGHTRLEEGEEEEAEKEEKWMEWKKRVDKPLHLQVMGHNTTLARPYFSLSRVFLACISSSSLFLLPS